ncbi:MAG: c-type cytochrome [Flavobacteriaceae bacterium]|nr:c-type cytochrome [Flavobacteriaceae bacterium]
MNKKVILLVSVAFLFMSCNQTKKEEFVNITEANKDLDLLTNQEKSKGYTLMKNNCYVCHNPNTASHDDILAPPFKAVKMHYNRAYSTKEEFVNAMVNWVQNPEEDKALMFGAVKRFKVMPKLPLPTKDLEKIATYIYDNDLEEPKWMEKHMKNKKNGCNHKNGKTCENKC